MTSSPRTLLRSALLDARRARDRDLVDALRICLAAIDNAEAVPAESRRAGAVEASPVGLGATEVERLALTAEDEREVVRGEIAELREAGSSYDVHGRAERAVTVRRVVAALEELLTNAG